MPHGLFCRFFCDFDGAGFALWLIWFDDLIGKIHRFVSLGHLQSELPSSGFSVLRSVWNVSQHYRAVRGHLPAVTFHLIFADIADFLPVEIYPVCRVADELSFSDMVLDHIYPQPCVVAVTSQKILMVLVSGDFHAAVYRLYDLPFGTIIDGC